MLGNIGNGKAPGMDDTPIELWKAAGEEGVDIVWRICKLCIKQWEAMEHDGQIGFPVHIVQLVANS